MDNNFTQSEEWYKNQLTINMDYPEFEKWNGESIHELVYIIMFHPSNNIRTIAKKSFLIYSAWIKNTKNIKMDQETNWITTVEHMKFLIKSYKIAFTKKGIVF
jgi:hypothetical protein